MNSEKGITLVSLVLYVVVIMIVLGVMSSIINQFYQNTNSLEEDTEEILELNHFNTYFLKEVKAPGNKVDTIKDNYILFSSGNSFYYSNGQIYYNNIVISEKVKEFNIISGENKNQKNNNIINVTLVFESFSKTLNYKVEEIF